MINRRQFISSTVAIGGTWLTSNKSWGRPQALTELSLMEVSNLIRRGEVSPVELTQACLSRIEKRNPALNAFVTLTEKKAMLAARRCEKELQQGQYRGPLHGIPIGLKDNIDTANIPTTAASAALANRIPVADAQVVSRLKDAGAIILGKLNMDECAYGISTTTGIFGATQNPWREGYSTGGSSGGPAAAVAAQLCYGAVGTDTGGSIRQPASWCGVTGLKPSYSLVSTRGVIPLSWSLDHVGPIARSAEDTALLLQAITGAATSTALVATGAKIKGLRLGKPTSGYYQQLNPEVEAAINVALKQLTEMTAGFQPVELPPVPRLGVMFVEAAAYYGDKLKESPTDFSPSVRALLNMGEKISSTDYALDLRKLHTLRKNMPATFANVDLLITPTTPNLPFTIEEASQPPKTHGPPVAARNTVPFDLYGLPTISIPCGISRSGLPIGLQISGPPGGEEKVLALALAWQSHTRWHLGRPPE